MEFFSPHRRGLNGLTATCKRCRTRKSKACLKLKFGITLDEWNAMFAEQGGCCKICGAHQSTLKKRLAVDHCHTTLQIRGLLCQHCNQMLGHARDKASTLRTAANYLDESNGKHNPTI